LVAAWNSRSNDENVLKIHAAYDQLATQLGLELRVDHEGMIRCFQNLGLDGLSDQNKLSPADNARLASSQDIREIAALLVQGIARLSKSI
jgi:hypothetical protein